MKELAQKIDIPGYGSVTGHQTLKPEFSNLGSLMGNFLNLFFYLAIFLAFFWMVWGAFQYIFAGGDKNSLANARKRIIWAVVGLLITAITYLIAQAVGEILSPNLKTPLSLIQVAYAAPVNIGEHYGFGNYTSLGQAIDQLRTPAFMIAGTAVVFYLVIGGLRYLMSGGDKEKIGSARAMITHAVIGFILLLLIFLIMEIIPEILGSGFSVIQR